MTKNIVSSLAKHAARLLIAVVTMIVSAFAINVAFANAQSISAECIPTNELASADTSIVESVSVNLDMYKDVENHCARNIVGFTEDGHPIARRLGC